MEQNFNPGLELIGLSETGPWWIVIYPVDSTIQLLNNQGQMFLQ